MAKEDLVLSDLLLRCILLIVGDNAELAVIAYRAIQEGLTNARRHAPGAPVSLEVSATPQAGVHIHISNPIATDATETQRAHGAGLPGLAARVHSVNGQCRYGDGRSAPVPCRRATALAQLRWLA